MKHFTAADIERLSPYSEIVDALAAAYRTDIVTPPRHHHTIANTDGADATLLLMPAWRNAEAVGVKIVTVFPDNAKRGEPSVNGVYFWQDARDGKPLASFDGAALTVRRTAGASALAARYLARKDACTHLIVGTGAVASQLIRAHATQRPIENIYVWGRTKSKAEAVAHAAREDGFNAEAITDLEGAACGADIISCATFSGEPLILGRWLKPGAHLDLVGAFKPDMRESDDEAVKRATLFCDTKATAPCEAGDLTAPIKAGVISPGAIAGDLSDLARGAHPGRTDEDEITLYKSVGAAIQDYAAADLIWRQSHLT
ncbi:MAG: ornithine cyclodeaminase family protein [Pseudomonadota bacterium]